MGSRVITGTRHCGGRRVITDSPPKPPLVEVVFRVKFRETELPPASKIDKLVKIQPPRPKQPPPRSPEHLILKCCRLPAQKLGVGRFSRDWADQFTDPAPAGLAAQSVKLVFEQWHGGTGAKWAAIDDRNGR